MQTIKSKQAFQLMLRQHELEAVYDLLDQINRLDTSQKRYWINNNSELLVNAFNSFLNISQADVANINSDGETGQISSRIVYLLDKTTEMMKSLFNHPADLVS